MGRQNPSALGLVRILQEGQHQFDIVDSKSDLGPYRLVILPDFIPLGPALAAKVDAHLAKGGALLATYKSGLNEAGDAFATPALGVSYKGEAPFSPDFLVPKGALAAGLPGAEYVVYKKGLEVEPLPGSEVLVETNVPYFNRTWDHYFSHRHTPSSGKPGYPGVVKNGRAIYFMHPLFAQYQQNAPRWCKQIVLNAISAAPGRSPGADVLAFSRARERERAGEASAATWSTCCTTCPSGAASTSTWSRTWCRSMT